MHYFCTHVYVCCTFLYSCPKEHVHGLSLERRPAEGMDAHLRQNENHQRAVFHTCGCIIDNPGLTENPNINLLYSTLYMPSDY